MGIDLAILPAPYVDKDDYTFDYSHDIIGFERDSDLFDVFRKAEEEVGVELIKPITTFKGNCKNNEYDYVYGETYETPYSEVIKSIQVKDIKVQLMHVKEDMYWKNKAIIAFILQLPDDLKLWLFWH